MVVEYLLMSYQKSDLTHTTPPLPPSGKKGQITAESINATLMVFMCGVSM